MEQEKSIIKIERRKRAHLTFEERIVITDNGSEFSSLFELEKGSVENHNGLFR